MTPCYICAMLSRLLAHLFGLVLVAGIFVWGGMLRRQTEITSRLSLLRYFGKPGIWISRGMGLYLQALACLGTLLILVWIVMDITGR